MRYVNSEAVQAYEYRPARRELLIRYRDGGDYLYLDVPPAEARSFEDAPSKGRYLHAHILERYRFRRLSS